MMKKRIIVLTISSLFLIVGYSSALNVVNQNDSIIENEGANDISTFIADIFVDDDAEHSWYDETHVKTIQEGVNNASEGDTIFVYNGTYVENLVVDKAITLTGENKDTTIIDETGGKQGIYITADNVNISGFTIKNVTVEWWDRSGITIKGNKTRVFNNIITNNRRGMLLYEVYGVIVEDNLFLENHNIHPWYDSYNLQLYKSYDNVISGNNFINEKKFTLIDVELFDSDNNQIYNNSFTGSLKNAICLTGSDNNIIRNNDIDIVDGRHIGIQLIGSNKNEIHHNNIKNNFQGIGLRGSICNKIHHNNFINCTIKAYTLISRFNLFYRNYWGRPRILPKRIYGIGSGIFLLKFDLRPAKEPYDI